jgi:flagellar motor switch protein FliM
MDQEPQKIHAVQTAGVETLDPAAAPKVVLFDFRKPGQTPGSQMRAVDVLKQKFLHRIVSSLSAYLRSSVTAQMLAVDHLPYGEFLRGLPSPTCVVSIGLRPYESTAVLELNPSLVFPIIELLLGGSGKAGAAANREITEIEQNVLDGLFRIIMQALADAWKDVLPVTLTLESVGREARLIYAPHEPMVALSIDVKLEEGGGRLNLAIPSEILALEGEDGDAQSTPRKLEATEGEQARTLDLLREAKCTLETHLEGPRLRVRELLELKEGDVLAFDHPIDEPLGGFVNGKRKFSGQIVSTGKRKAFQID